MGSSVDSKLGSSDNPIFISNFDQLKRVAPNDVVVIEDKRQIVVVPIQTYRRDPLLKVEPRYNISNLSSNVFTLSVEGDYVVENKYHMSSNRPLNDTGTGEVLEPWFKTMIKVGEGSFAYKTMEKLLVEKGFLKKRK